MNTNATFQWELLLPTLPWNFSEITPIQAIISSGFIYTTFILMITISLFVLTGTIRSLRWIKLLTQLLEGINVSDLADKRQEIKDKANISTFVGKIWNEFDETLVSSFDGTRLYNTVDASYFFNMHNLARGVTESRFISATPGFLTAIGVLGTFVGLQLGIGGLDLDFGNAKGLNSSRELTNRIAPLIQGATIAFSTSVWGILTSLIFNFYEKVMEFLLNDKITKYQDRVDFLYPRQVAENSLVEIAEHVRDSKNSLSMLAEQIGNRMQEAMDASLGPAIKQLVDASKDLSDKQSLGSQKALTDLVGTFTNSMSKEGEKQRENMESGANELNEAIKSVGLSMNQFMEKFNSQLGDWKIEKEGQVQLTNNIIEQGKSLSDRSEKSQEAFEETTLSVNQAAARLDVAAGRLEEFGGVMKSASESVSSTQLEASRLSLQAAQENQSVVQRFKDLMTQIDNVRERFLEISNQLKGSSDGIGVRTSEFLEKMKTQLEIWEQEKTDQQTLTSNLINQGESITNQANLSQQAITKIAESIVQSSENMEVTSGNIATLGERIEGAAQILSSKQTEATESFEKSSQESLRVTENLRSVVEELQGMRQSFAEVGESIKDSSASVGGNFEQLNEKVQEHITHMEQSLRDYREDSQRQLNEYAEKVTGTTGDRLNQWNEQTREFSSTLVQAVSSMNDMLDDIDEKLKNRQI